tara:strand:+ start:4841 stop:5050 length:210 start_codon:yes stop_codon:yes gene_type:complete
MAKGNARVGQPKGSRLAFDDTKQEKRKVANKKKKGKKALTDWTRFVKDGGYMKKGGKGLKQASKDYKKK